MRKLPSISILSSGRFYVCDLARELSAIGHDVTFYSLVPKARLRKFGLKPENSRCLLGFVLPFYFLSRSKNSVTARTGERMLKKSIDYVASRLIKKTDVFIGMSGLCNATIPKVRNGGVKSAWVERASRHIVSQKNILSRLPFATQVSEFDVERELIDYKNADFVSVLSQHCKESFEEEGFSSDRIVLNRIGVDVTMFPPTDAPCKSLPTVIMTGAWSYRKGCDILADAIGMLSGVRLIHVGPVLDCPLPKEDWFSHYDKVDQPLLHSFYKQAHVFCLASHEEGLAIVQLQALSSGCRIVCTDRTGGADLKQFVSDWNTIRVVPAGEVRALSEAISLSLSESKDEQGPRIRLSRLGQEEISWASYAKRYSSNILSRV